MNKKCVLLLVIILNPFMVFLGADTVRNKAQSHFNSLSWTMNPDLLPATPVQGVNVPGSNETFPSLQPSNPSEGNHLYPRMEGIGILDYTGIDSALLSTVNEVSSHFMDKKLPSEVCDSSRSFLATLTTYRLSRIPDPAAVFFGRPIEEGEGTWKVLYCLSVKRDTKKIPVFLEVLFKANGASYTVYDISLDGESYVTAAQ